MFFDDGGTRQGKLHALDGLGLGQCYTGIDFHLNNCTALSVKILDNVPYVRLTRIFLSGLVKLII